MTLHNHCIGICEVPGYGDNGCRVRSQTAVIYFFARLTSELHGPQSGSALSNIPAPFISEDLWLLTRPCLSVKSQSCAVGKYSLMGKISEMTWPKVSVGGRVMSLMRNKLPSRTEEMTQEPPFTAVAFKPPRFTSKPNTFLPSGSFHGPFLSIAR